MALTVGVNSWVTRAEADTYKGDKWNPGEWFALTNTQKDQALISAYRWIQSRSEYSISPAATAEKVKSAQIECADYIVDHWSEHKERTALYTQGVRNFKISKWSEKLEESELPQIVKDLLDDYLIGLGGFFPEFERDIDE